MEPAIECEICGSDLPIERELLDYGELIYTVKPCQHCLGEYLKDAKEEIADLKDRLRAALDIARRIPMTEKRFAEINGEFWEAGYPLCSGCPELIISGYCAWEGNGCRFPSSRMEKPRSFRDAFLAAARMNNVSYEEFARMTAEYIADEQKAKEAAEP